jgi:transcriptional regulator with XRE-family HTH domain
MPERQESGDKLLMRGFGERLRLLRKAYGERFGAEHHTKARWAKRLWVSPAMYGRWEAGANLPKFVDLLRISLLFRVDPNYLVAGVLSEHLVQWLYRALKAGNPELLDAADYWQRQSELFARANRALADEEPPSGRNRPRTIPNDAHDAHEERSTKKSSGSSHRRLTKRRTLARHN